MPEPGIASIDPAACALKFAPLPNASKGPGGPGILRRTEALVAQAVIQRQPLCHPKTILHEKVALRIPVSPVIVRQGDSGRKAADDDAERVGLVGRERPVSVELVLAVAPCRQSTRC